jgi:chromosome segregation ATPase
VYKADFDEERRDRERIYGLIDDMKKKEAQLEGHAAQEIAAYKQELGDIRQDLQYTKEQLHKHKTLLADIEKLNKIRVQEAQKYKDEADAARGETSKYFQDAESFRESADYWRSRAETNQREVQAMASQVKQFAKEIERLRAKVRVWYF